MTNRVTPANFKCSFCGEIFKGFMLTVCDKCLDRRKPGEKWEEFQARMKQSCNAPGHNNKDKGHNGQ